MVKKAPANPGAESAAQGDPVAPWTRGNNCPQSSKGLEKVIVNDVEISEQLVRCCKVESRVWHEQLTVPLKLFHGSV